ncbi:MAG: Sua5/YciO/YrdC/YwlC family protein, partial [Agathobacter sp.]
MITRKIVVQGLVQGIGFRPFVAELCEQLHISGWVKNTDGIVTLLATGEEEAIALLVEKLQSEAPAGAVVLQVQVTEPEESLERNVIVYSQVNQKQANQNQFSIVESEKNEGKKKEKDSFPLLPADIATCKRCEEELHDEKNRRFRHPFISCTSCGPRYSIIDEIPYDREHITMRDFEMCPTCKQEYTQKGNVRRHAQTIACKECGPTLTYKEQINKTKENKHILEKQNEEAITYAINHLKKGGILAVKDIGGYHLAASPFEEDTIRKLRNLKGREAKPFAVLFPSVESVAEYCEIDEKEEELLTSSPRPIVLLRKKKDGKKLHDLVCGSSPDIGAMLCCNPVQIMLAKALGPLIMTSANVSGELITIENEQMEE